MIALIITTNARMPGARLSSPGNWTNLPFPSVEAAEARAAELGVMPAAVKREAYR
jgi:hypothetical protein